MQKLRKLIRLFKLLWKTSKIKAFVIFWFKGANSVKFLRQRIILILGIFHFIFFFHYLGSVEMLFAYLFFWEISGPQIDKYQDYDETDPDSIDYIPPKDN